MKTPEKLTILLVEDNPSDCFLIEQMLRNSGLAIDNVLTADKHEKAVRLRDFPVNIILLDLSLPDSFGMNTFIDIKKHFPNIPIIILTGLADSEMALQALNLGAQDYLVKGEFNSSILLKSIQYSIERKKIEEKVLESEEKYRQIFYKNPFPMWITDRDTGHILEVNEAAIEKYKYQKEEFLKLEVEDIQSACIDPILLSLGGKPEKQLWNHITKDGEALIVELTSYPITYFGKTATQVQINDVTDKLFLEKELALKNQQMIDAVLDAQENERRVIGEELHDNINQILTAIKISLGFVIEQQEPRKDLLQKCMKHASLAIDEVRRLSRTLILPSNLRELGLVASLDILVKDIESITSMSIEFIEDGIDEECLCEDQKTALYRIVQEQMNNIIKYANASEVIISLTDKDGKIKLIISDNGRGFDPSVKAKGVGLHNISNRVKLFNGEVVIESAPGKGCRLIAQLNSKSSIPQEAA